MLLYCYCHVVLAVTQSKQDKRVKTGHIYYDAASTSRVRRRCHVRVSQDQEFLGIRTTSFDFSRTSGRCVVLLCVVVLSSINHAGNERSIIMMAANYKSYFGRGCNCDDVCNEKEILN